VDVHIQRVAAGRGGSGGGQAESGRAGCQRVV
jgi:hypothetical protein